MRWSRSWIKRSERSKQIAMGEPVKPRGRRAEGGGLSRNDSHRCELGVCGSALQLTCLCSPRSWLYLYLPLLLPDSILPPVLLSTLRSPLSFSGACFLGVEQFEECFVDASGSGPTLGAGDVFGQVVERVVVVVCRNGVDRVLV